MPNFSFDKASIRIGRAGGPGWDAGRDVTVAPPPDSDVTLAPPAGPGRAGPGRAAGLGHPTPPAAGSPASRGPAPDQA